MHTSLRWSLLFMVSVSSPAIAQEERAKVYKQFSIYNDGDALLIPYKMACKEYLFILDTGSSTTLFDKEVIANHPVLGKPIKLPSDPIATRLLRSYGARPHLAIPTCDLTKVRQGIGHDVYGIIGMDKLGGAVISLDFDKGRLAVLESCDGLPGTSIDLVYKNNRPCVTLWLKGWGNITFMIDTGFLVMGHDGFIKKSLFKTLSANNLLKPTGVATSRSLKGRASHRYGTLLYPLSIGGHRYEGFVAGEDDEVNIIGLRFLLNYNITFDFRNDRMYMLPRKKPYKPLGIRDESGLHLLRIERETIVERVDEGSPAAKAGIKAADVIVKASGKESEDMRLWTVRGLLTEKRKRISLVIRRGKMTKEVELQLGKIAE